MIGKRHPVVEYAVFGLAGLLALILAYYGYARWAGGRRAASPEAPLGRSAEAPESRRQPQPDETQGSFHGGGSLPTVRFSEPRKRSGN